MERERVSAETPWGDAFGYSRAVRVGDVVKVSGTVATDEDGGVHGEGDLYEQAAYALRKIGRALEALGASLDDVVRTRLFVVDIDDWEGLARAHGEAFGDVRPATTMVEVSRLILPEYLVEIEAEAVVDARG